MNTGFIVVTITVIILSALLAGAVSLFIVYRKKKKILKKGEELFASMKGGIELNANTRATAIAAIKTAHNEGREEGESKGERPIGGASQSLTGASPTTDSTIQSNGISQQSSGRESIPIRTTQSYGKIKKRIRIHKPFSLRSEQDNE
jgi:hypothetical protein